MRRFRVTKEWTIESWASVLLLGVLLCAPLLIAQRQPPPVSTQALDQLSASVAQMVARVAPAIVRVEAIGYSESNQDEERSENHLLSKTENVGSGIVFDANGYIVTNAHVVKGAKRVQVIVDKK